MFAARSAGCAAAERITVARRVGATDSGVGCRGRLRAGDVAGGSAAARRRRRGRHAVLAARGCSRARGPKQPAVRAVRATLGAGVALCSAGGRRGAGVRQRSGAIAKRLRHTVVRLVAAIGSANDAPRRGRSAVARQVHLQLRVTVTAVLEAKRLELVVARRKHHRVRLQVAPGVARGVLRAVDADERAEPVVGVHAELVLARHEDAERNW